MFAGRSLAIVTALLLNACLPGDVRPEPGSILLTVSADEAISTGFTTDDGWAVTYERFLTAIGDADLDGDPDGREDSCNAYAEARYDRLFDFVVAPPQKLGLLYGLGVCSVEYRFRAPSDDSILTEGTTSSDRTFLRAEGTDAYAEDERGTLFVRGFATKDGIQKRFEWVFRHGFEIDRCETEDGEGYVSVLDIDNNAEHELEVVVRGAELFRIGPSDDAPTQFELYARADADGDGLVTLEELAAVDAPAQEDWFESPEGDVDDEEALEPADTLADLVYEHLLPRVTRMSGGGKCSTELRDRG